MPWTEKYDPRPGNREFPLYPHIFLTANAKYFFTGEGWTKPAEDAEGSQGYFHPGFWEPFNGNKYKKVNDLTKPTQRGFGTSCWLGSIRRQKIMVMGGGWPATSTTNVIDLDSSSAPKFKAGPPLQGRQGVRELREPARRQRSGAGRRFRQQDRQCQPDGEPVEVGDREVVDGHEPTAQWRASAVPLDGLPGGRRQRHQPVVESKGPGPQQHRAAVQAAIHVQWRAADSE